MMMNRKGRNDERKVLDDLDRSSSSSSSSEFSHDREVRADYSSPSLFDLSAAIPDATEDSNRFFPSTASQKLGHDASSLSLQILPIPFEKEDEILALENDSRDHRTNDCGGYDSDSSMPHSVNYSLPHASDDTSVARGTRLNDSLKQVPYTTYDTSSGRSHRKISSVPNQPNHDLHKNAKNDDDFDEHDGDLFKDTLMAKNRDEKESSTNNQPTYFDGDLCTQLSDGTDDDGDYSFFPTFASTRRHAPLFSFCRDHSTSDSEIIPAIESSLTTGGNNSHGGSISLSTITPQNMRGGHHIHSDESMSFGRSTIHGICIGGRDSNDKIEQYTVTLPLFEDEKCNTISHKSKS